jgi:CHAT domain-containing protein
MDATIAQLQDQLSRLHGPVRVQVLMRLGQEFADRYWRTGPGTPAALGQLSAAIEATQEAYHLMAADDPFRPQAGALLGYWLHARYGAHGSPEADRNTAMAVLSEALEYPELPPVLVTIARIALGQLHLSRAIEAMTPAALRGGFLGGTSTDSLIDAEQASRYFREILDGPPISPEINTIAQTMLDLTEAMQLLLSGDLARFDVGKLMQAMAALQQVQQNGLSFGIPSMGLPTPIPLGLDLAAVKPIDRPGVNLQGDAGQPPAIPPRRPAAASPTPIDPDSPRRAARNRLAALVGDPEKPVWEQARLLLAAEPERAAAGDLDAYVGAAANAVDAEPGSDPVEAGLDRLLSAVGLCLRERRDGSGWAEDLNGAGYRTAAELLLAAGNRIPAGHPAAAVVVESVGGLLDQKRPLSGAVTEIAGPLGEYASEVPAGTAIVTALGDLCRAIAALTTGAEIDPAPLATAVVAVPADHAWYGVLTTAVEQVQLAAAVRSGAPIAVETDPDGLAPMLDALLRDDTEALRVAVDASRRTARPPRVAAVLGAGYLELAARAPVQERDDLAVAIELLSASAEALDSADERLRTHTWWRLAQAYRRRGASTDAEWSRDAGLEALGGGDLDLRSAARFAGWMLADRRPAEAYTALEMAAAGTGRPAAANPLAEDVLNVILGIAPGAARPPDVPGWIEVGAAVRKAGASALLYLHPTDDAGRTAGVLCLDSGTGRLDVLANVPVTDPLTSDDPGWSAIVSRWSGGSLLIAATGDLHRIALPAVLVGEGRRLAQDVSLAHVSSGAQVIDLAQRGTAPVGKAPLFVVNPRRDRDAEMADALVLQRLFYPRSTCLGHALEPVEGSGTREDLLARLPSASLVHLACGLNGRQLELTGGEVLDLTMARGSGLVILTECGTEGLRPSAEAFLGTGFSGVIGWQWPVPASFAALALFMTHLLLVDHQLPPARAVATAQQWMLDPGRDLPPVLPEAHRRTVETTDLTRPALWAALAYAGC